MKTKKFSKKLTLSKKTIADLNKGEMSNLRGGIFTGEYCWTTIIAGGRLTCTPCPYETAHDCTVEVC